MKDQEKKMQRMSEAAWLSQEDYDTLLGQALDPDIPVSKFEKNLEKLKLLREFMQ